jgi:hypothetical protein
VTRRLGLAIAGICVSAVGLICSGRLEAAPDIIGCTAGADCDAKWARAKQWVLDNSKYPVKVDTEAEISTVTRTRFNDPGLIVTVNRFARHDGTFVITLRVGCGMLVGPCKPSVGQAQESFARYVTLSSTVPVPAQASPTSAVAAGATLKKPDESAPMDVGRAENPDNMLLFCRGGGKMTLHFAYRPVNDGRDGVLLELSFQRATHGAHQTPLAPGECAFADRALREDEPALLSVSGPASGLGLDMHLNSDGHLTSYAVNGIGGVHDAIGTVANGVLNTADFSLYVADVGTLSLRALVK